MRKSNRSLLVITEAGDAWPSASVRAYAYRELFERDGVRARFVALRPACLVRARQRLGDRPMLGGARMLTSGAGWLAAAFNSKRAPFMAKDFDCIMVQKLKNPALFDKLRALGSTRLVYDLNDALWLPRQRDIFGSSVERFIREADCVTCDNPHGVAFARSLNPNVHLVPDPCQIELFPGCDTRANRESSTVLLGWIGSPSTAFNLYYIWEALEAVFAAHDNITLRLVGVGSDISLLPRFERVRVTTVAHYDQAKMIAEVSNMNIGLFPLFKIEDSLARGVLKASIYMGGRACVVTRPIGQVRDLIIDGVNGRFAETTAEWIAVLDELIKDQELRKRLGEAGYLTAAREFSLARCYQHLQKALWG